MKKITIVNMFLSIVLLIILITINTSVNFFYIMYFTGIIGWLFPFFTIFISGIVYFRKIHSKLASILNLLTLIITIYILILIIRVWEFELIIPFIIYYYLGIGQLVNLTHYLSQYKKHNKNENEQIHNIKKVNNGIIK